MFFVRRIKNYCFVLYEGDRMNINLGMFMKILVIKLKVYYLIFRLLEYICSYLW